MTPTSRPHRLTAWLDEWGGILPLLVAEFVVWLGFGGLLPVLPLYFTEQGVDLSTLGLVIAAWPAARLVSEPIFGWLADRTARVPLMVIGLLATGIFGALAAGPHRAAGVRRPARPGRAERRDLRPGGPRLPHRRDAARAQARRGVRAVRGGPDGRACCSGPRSAASARRTSAASAFVFVFSAVTAVISAAGHRAARPGDADADAPRAAARLDRVPAGPAVARVGGPPPTSMPIARGPPARTTPIAPLESRPHRGHRHQRRRLLRGRHVRGHLEPVPRGSRRRPRAHRADVRDVRPAGPAPVADRRADRRPARIVRVHRPRARCCRSSRDSCTR